MQVTKYMNHATQAALIKMFQAQNQGINGEKKLLALPVCPKCERVGLRDKGWTDHKIMKCPHCGYSGKASHVLMEYIKDELYK